MSELEQTPPAPGPDRRDENEGRRDVDESKFLARKALEVNEKVGKDLKYLGIIVSAAIILFTSGVAVAGAWIKWGDLPNVIAAQDDKHLEKIAENTDAIREVLARVEDMTPLVLQGTRNDAYFFCVQSGEPPRACMDRLFPPEDEAVQ